MRLEVGDADLRLVRSLASLSHGLRAFFELKLGVPRWHERVRPIDYIRTIIALSDDETWTASLRNILRSVSDLAVGDVVVFFATRSRAEEAYVSFDLFIQRRKKCRSRFLFIPLAQNKSGSDRGSMQQSTSCAVPRPHSYLTPSRSSLEALGVTTKRWSPRVFAKARFESSSRHQ
jgi:hypothetical protein